MKKVFCSIALLAGLCLATAPVYAQDSRRERPRREVANDDMETEGDEPVAEEDAAQPKKKRTRVGVGIGMEAGVGVNTVEITGQKTRIDATGTLGGYVDIQMAGRFYVQPGIYYIRNGGSNVVLDKISTVALEMRITTLEVPVMIAYRSGLPGAKAHFTIGAGGYFAYNAGANINGIPLSIGSDTYYDDVKATEVGVGLNVGVELRNGLFFRIKGQRGLTDLQPDPASPHIYSSSIVGTIGYVWRKRAKHYRAPEGREESAAGRRM